MPCMDRVLTSTRPETPSLRMTILEATILAFGGITLPRQATGQLLT